MAKPGVESIPVEVGKIMAQTRLEGQDKRNAVEDATGKLADLSWARFWFCY